MKRMQSFLKRISDRVFTLHGVFNIMLVIMIVASAWVVAPRIVKSIHDPSCYTAYETSSKVYDQITRIVNDETQRPANNEQLTVWIKLKHTSNDNMCIIFASEKDADYLKNNTNYMRGLISTYKAFRQDSTVTPEQAQAFQHNQKLSQTCPYDCPTRN